MTIEIDSEAATPMLARYSMWIGETARSTDSDRSSGAPRSSRAGMIGTGVAPTSAMIRNRLRR